jgi:hypothetical protein
MQQHDGRPAASVPDSEHDVTHVDLFQGETVEHGGDARPRSPTFAELLIDCEEDRVLRAVLVGMLREAIE